MTGCPPSSDGGDDNNGGGGGELSKEQFVELTESTYAKLYCQSLFECPTSVGEGLPVLGRFPDQASCEANIFESLGSGPLERLKESVDSGRVAYDASKASACKAGIDAFVASRDVCSPLEELEIDACDEVFVGRVAVGDNCLDSQDCADGGVCSFDSDDCYGTCQSSGVCGDEVCGADEFCTFGVDGDTCAPKLDLGDACNDGDDCTATTDDASCLTALNSTEGVCTAFDTVGEGENCGYVDQFCQEGFFCNSLAECEPDEEPTIEIVAQGEQCNFDGRYCEPGVVCTDISISQSGLAGTCGVAKKVGEECYLAFECEIGLTCVGAQLGGEGPPMSGTCGELLSNGEACSSFFDCASGNCEDGTCVAESEDSCVLP